MHQNVCTDMYNSILSVILSLKLHSVKVSKIITNKSYLLFLTHCIQFILLAADDAACKVDFFMRVKITYFVVKY